MYKITSLITACFFFSIVLAAQNKQDYHWIFGNDKAEGDVFLSFHIDFNTIPFEIGTRDAGAKIRKE